MSDSTQGNDAPQASQGTDEAPKFVTNEALNAAITARFKSFEKKVEESVGGMFGTFSTKLSETLGAQLASLKPAEVQEAPKAKAPAATEDPAVKQLREELASLKQQNQRIENERKAERASARDMKIRAEVSSHLTNMGIPAPLARKAVFELVDGTKRVAWQSDESSALVFRQDDGEVADLESGLKTWLTSEDAKFYKPASGATGSGDRSSSSNSAKAPQTAEAIALESIARHFNLPR